MIQDDQATPKSEGVQSGTVRYLPRVSFCNGTVVRECPFFKHLRAVNQGFPVFSYRSWEEGKVLIFDDSFEHEVWQDADTYRLIFIVDVWHPELTAQQRRTLPAI